ncbi:hypothetical protein TNCV_3580641 [Trichonephila clavipes]|nr:hypothetical protein TNCV_3580641 [Trichonephila clavipes]
MRSTKDQLVEKDVLMPVKHNVFLWNLPDVEEVPSHDGETILLWSPWKYRCGQRTVRMAVMACSQKQRSLRAHRSITYSGRPLPVIRVVRCSSVYMFKLAASHDSPNKRVFISKDNLAANQLLVALCL